MFCNLKKTIKSCLLESNGKGGAKPLRDNFISHRVNETFDFLGGLR
jgi:hypothetical protein